VSSFMFYKEACTRAFRGFKEDIELATQPELD
jgi:hypothetical protein